MSKLSNEQHKKMVDGMDKNTVTTLLFIINEELDKFSQKFIGCENEKDMYKLQGEHKALSELSKNLERIISQKEKILEDRYKGF